MTKRQTSEMGSRISDLIHKLRMNQSSFATSIGVTPSAINSIILGKSNPSYDTLELIVQTHQKVNRQWLMSGDGDMFGKPEEPNNKPTISFGEKVIQDLIEEMKLLRNQLEVKDSQIDKLLNILGKDDLSGASLHVTYKREMGRVMPLWNKLVTSPLTVGQQ